jgi:hypothetical protein
MTLDELEKQDGEFLLGRAEFQRFLLRVIQMARIFSCTTDGSGERNLSFDEGRRSLGLEILEMAEAAQPQVHSLIGIPASTLTQVLLEEARRPKPEKPNGRRYDRQSELSGDDANE